MVALEGFLGGCPVFFLEFAEMGVFFGEECCGAEFVLGEEGLGVDEGCEAGVR